MMPRLLLIETSTTLCSVALAEGDRIVASREDPSRQHASLTAPFVEAVLKERGLKVADCDAVCVSKGPGSYTGLRVGVSTAKGLCFGAGIPLLAVGSLDVLAWQAIDGDLLPAGCKAIVPMIDARRMEVYSAVYSPAGERQTEVAPTIVEPGTFDALEGPVLFIGDGVEKCRPLLPEGSSAVVCCPHAKALLHPAGAAFAAGRFEDLAYFEPCYLKDFIATVPKKLF